MLTQQELEKILNEHISIMKRKYYVKRIGYFGSFARNEQTEDSDIDILVEFSQPVGWEYFHLKYFLEDLLQRPIDLVTINGLKPQMKDQILEEVRYQ